jgi:hypothetical protein
LRKFEEDKMATTVKASLTRIDENTIAWEIYGTTDLEQLHVHMSVKVGLQYETVDSHSSFQDEYMARGIVEVPGKIMVPWSAKAVGYPGNEMATLNERLEIGETFSSGSKSV